MGKRSEFNDALERGDYRLASRYSGVLFPHLPQAKTDADREIALHLARTMIPEISFKNRAYSHAWLTERGLPSQLPDDLRPSAERLYPNVVEGVFISANAQSPILKPVIDLVENAMSEAVLDCYANGDTDPAIVRKQIQAARQKEKKKLVGILSKEISSYGER